MSMFIETTATKKIFALKKRIRFVSGGSSSSKTISILLWLIDYAQSHKNEIISVVSESMPHLKKGALRDFENIMKAHGYYKEERHNQTNSIYEFETGTIIEFFGADQSSKVHGPRRDILFVNEANHIDYSVFTQLEIRTRKIIWVDSNPTHEYWMYTQIMPNNDIDFVTLTYLDNEALEPAIVQSLESKKGNKNFWKVYGEGQLGQAEGRIYTDWTFIDAIPHEARLERYGLDFGFSCLAGETMVETSEGAKRIDQIREGEFVLTRSGFRRVSFFWDRGEKDVYDVDFGHGRAIIATGDHRVFTVDGWKRVDELSESETLCLLKPASFAEKSTRDTRTENIPTTFSAKSVLKEKQKRDGFIEIFTKNTTEQYPKGLSSITLMAIRRTTIRLISLPSHLRNILQFIITSLKQDLLRFLMSNFMRFVPSLASGSTTGKRDGLSQWRQLGKRSNSVQSAESRLSLPTLIRSFVEQFVEKRLIQEEASESTPARIAERDSLLQLTSSATPVLERVPVSFRLLKGKRKVYDLTVEGEHEFFANGLLVHNCDPTAIVGLYRYNGGYIVDEIMYLKGQSNKQIADTLLNLPKALVIADSAEPKSIAEIRSYGINILPAQKGQGSINQGIQYVQDQKISVTKQSINLIKEYRNYLWFTDKDGKILNEPDPRCENHCLDGIRYSLDSFRPMHTGPIVKKDFNFSGHITY